MASLNDMIYTLDRIGVADIILPFILVFTIVFAVLKKVKIFGANDKFALMVALVMGLGVVFPHVTGKGPDIVPLLNRALPNIAVLVIAILMLLLLLGVWGEEFSFAGKPLAAWIVVLAIAAVVYIFGAAAGWGWNIPPALNFLTNADTQALLIVLLVFGLIVAYITQDPAEAKNRHVLKSLNDGFGSIFDGQKKH